MVGKERDYRPFYTTRIWSPCSHQCFLCSIPHLYSITCFRWQTFSPLKPLLSCLDLLKETS
ncbi:hypothetical protein F383_31044 [Gossypium arboreum]|uniref:Uncharacterized protein n=1 Tax=Gossypium arboreum TaxID=29729 RepID=A0A0B0PI08_GOSAR|nr:hypothetical protein F383_31044 [Gossypium arboreum]